MYLLYALPNVNTLLIGIIVHFLVGIAVFIFLCKFCILLIFILWKNINILVNSLSTHIPVAKLYNVKINIFGLISCDFFCYSFQHNDMLFIITIVHLVLKLNFTSFLSNYLLFWHLYFDETKCFVGWKQTEQILRYNI